MVDPIFTHDDLRRFWAKVQPPVDNGCMEWCGAKNAGGYGLFGKDHSSMLAHRVAWAISWGRVPVGADILHRCDNPPCVNVAHLFVGDAAANAADMVAKGRHRSQRATRCRAGHEYSGSNLYVRADGSRDCRACQRTRNAAWKKAHSIRRWPPASRSPCGPQD